MADIGLPCAAENIACRAQRTLIYAPTNAGCILRRRVTWAVKNAAPMVGSVEASGGSLHSGRTLRSAQPLPRIQASAYLRRAQRARDGRRLLTATALHAGLLHLGLNCVALASIGPEAEAVLGYASFATVRGPAWPTNDSAIRTTAVRKVGFAQPLHMLPQPTPPPPPHPTDFASVDGARSSWTYRLGLPAAASGCS